jgi:hypothetical protein
MACIPRWAFPLIAAVTFVVFFIAVAGSANAATIKVTVMDTNNVRVSGATVTIYQNGSEYVNLNNPGKTDVTGYFEFTGLPDGTYSVQADKNGYFSPSESVTLAGSEIGRAHV